MMTHKCYAIQKNSQLDKWMNSLDENRLLKYILKLSAFKFYRLQHTLFFFIIIILALSQSDFFLPKVKTFELRII